MGAQGGIGMDRYSSLAESGRSLDLTEFQFHSGCLDRKEEARERGRDALVDCAKCVIRTMCEHE